MLTVDGVEMVDVREAAQLTHRSPETVRRWIWSGRLAARRHGNRLLIARRDLETLLERSVRAQATGTLHEWATLVDEQRSRGLLGKPEKHRSAADLVLFDRSYRDGR